MKHGVSRKLQKSSRLQTFIKDVSPTPPGFPRPAWIKLNRLRTCGGLFRSCTHKWGMASTVAVSVARKGAAS